MRKNLLDDLTVGKPELTAVNSEASVLPSRPAPLGSKGAVGAMSKALAQIASGRQGAARAADIVEVDTALIERSIVRDRMRGDPADHAALVASIRDAGQQVPVLLRPHPTVEGRFQIAYGHRRIDALRELGRPARSMVRALTDAELVVAQGTENSARKDLSFIERATFAAALEERGFERGTIMAALSTDKTELSRLISVARAIPADVIGAIGPAPKTGRRRWISLVERLAGQGADKAYGFMDRSAFFAIESTDARFNALFDALAPPPLRSPRVRIWRDEGGRKLAKFERAGGRFTLSIDEDIEPAFGDYLLGRLPEILASFKRRGGA